MNYKQDKTEPFWWGLFSAGGVVAAMLIPVLIYFVGLAERLGFGSEASSYGTMRALFNYPLAKVFFFVVAVLPLYHVAHRIRFMLHEFGVRKLILPIHYFCYGGAIVGTGLAAYIFFYLL